MVRYSAVSSQERASRKIPRADFGEKRRRHLRCSSRVRSAHLCRLRTTQARSWPGSAQAGHGEPRLSMARSAGAYGARRIIFACPQRRNAARSAATGSPQTPCKPISQCRRTAPGTGRGPGRWPRRRSRPAPRNGGHHHRATTPHPAGRLINSSSGRAAVPSPDQCSGHPQNHSTRSSGHGDRPSGGEESA